MSVWGNAISALAVLSGVVLGGWLAIRNQEREWRRDHQREWRDIRLAAYNDFVSAYRSFVAFALEPSARIGAVPHPWSDNELMPFFDDAGRPYKERLESTWIAARLVLGSTETAKAGLEVITCARQVAAARADHGSRDIPPELFKKLWSSQDRFVDAVRLELGMDVLPQFY